MVNLLLTGRAAANVFNGDIEYNKNGRKMVREESLFYLLKWLRAQRLLTLRVFSSGV